jgi:hypothetical protein
MVDQSNHISSIHFETPERSRIAPDFPETVPRPTLTKYA